jgi:hypothetical protein
MDQKWCWHGTTQLSLLGNDLPFKVLCFGARAAKLQQEGGLHEPANHASQRSHSFHGSDPKSRAQTCKEKIDRQDASTKRGQGGECETRPHTARARSWRKWHRQGTMHRQTHRPRRSASGAGTRRGAARLQSMEVLLPGRHQTLQTSLNLYTRL